MPCGSNKFGVLCVRPRSVCVVEGKGWPNVDGMKPLMTHLLIHFAVLCYPAEKMESATPWYLNTTRK